MRMSRLFSQTLREAPADAEVESHILLVRAGFIRQLASGIFSYLPLAQRSLTRIEDIIRAEMNAIGGQEITMPVVTPADIWKETGRWYDVDAEMGRFCDRSNRDMVLAMTHEEVVADLVRKEIKSYRQLPQMIYHIQTKWRDDARPRSGLLRVREFTMKDSYSLDVDAEGLERQYSAHFDAYFRIFKRCGLETVAVKADVGMMGGSLSHEFVYLTPVGEDTILFCDSCDYSANGQVAVFAKSKAEAEEERDIGKVATPNTSTIEGLAKLLSIPHSRTAKALFVMGRFTGDDEDEGEKGETERLILALIRGDMEVNETKLANEAKALGLRPAREEEISAAGAVAGYASPIGLKDVFVIADDSIASSANLVAGANEEGYHFENANYGRDFTADIVADIATAGEGHSCAECGAALRSSRGVEVGNIFQLGTRYTDAMGCNYLDADGRTQSVVMGSYGIGVGRLLACIAQEHCDDDGLMWPISVAPYDVHLVVLAKGGGPAAEAGDKLYADLSEAGVDVLYDDRAENPGVKFKDADLIGVPLRITVGERSLKKGQVEVKGRDEDKAVDVAVDSAVSHVGERLAMLRLELE